MEIKTTSFVISNTQVSKCPTDKLPEFAFIGRSNVGKSSLINMLVGNPMAKTSAKPGKTLLINHFLINKQWYIVDLPGYGYAKVSLQERERLHKMITEYVEQRENLYCLFVLIDSGIPPQKIDMDFVDFLGEEQVPFVLVFTKTDKNTKNHVSQNVAAFKKAMLNTWEELPKIFLSSSEKKLGREELLSYIEEVLKS